MSNSQEKILLHTCCAPCACWPMQDLLDQGFQVDLYFFNPNIHPKKEYQARLDELREYVKKFSSVTLIIGYYNPPMWFEKIKGFEHEPERGQRCDICYELRLAETAKFASQNNYNYFGSTLSISPHKSSIKINDLGDSISKKIGINFFCRDWKKNDGFKKSCQIARDEDFYRQNYCGCVFSKR